MVRKVAALVTPTLDTGQNEAMERIIADIARDRRQHRHLLEHRHDGAPAAARRCTTTATARRASTS